MSSSIPWQRHALLTFSIGLTSLGFIVGLQGDSSNLQFIQGVCLKTGIVIFMWWLALPQLQRLNPWAVGTAGGLAVIAVVRPSLLLVIGKVALALAPILFLIWLISGAKRK